eukprot:867384-Pleurochrysis_carterae.AAC.1
MAQRRSSQMRMIGLSVEGGGVGAKPRVAAQLLAAAAGDMGAVDGVEAALLAARDADGEEAADGSAQRRLAEVGEACLAALRAALDALGAE